MYDDLSAQWFPGCLLCTSVVCVLKYVEFVICCFYKMFGHELSHRNSCALVVFSVVLIDYPLVVLILMLIVPQSC